MPLRVLACACIWLGLGPYASLLVTLALSLVLTLALPLLPSVGGMHCGPALSCRECCGELLGLGLGLRLGLGLGLGLLVQGVL